MKATSNIVSATISTACALLLAVFAGAVFRDKTDGSVMFGAFLIFIAVFVAWIGSIFYDQGGSCHVSSEGSTASLIQGHVYETVSCTLVGKDSYVVVVKDTHGHHWAFYAKKALPQVFVVRAGDERYVPFGKDFGKATVPAEPQT